MNGHPSISILMAPQRQEAVLTDMMMAEMWMWRCGDTVLSETTLTNPEQREGVGFGTRVYYIYI